jgi:hypothetical protein
MSIHKTFSPDIRLVLNDPVRLREIHIDNQPEESHFVGVDDCFKKGTGKHSKTRPTTTGVAVRIRAR